jgi:hypothetical protein
VREPVGPAPAQPSGRQPLHARQFGTWVAELSEPQGVFFSSNLISNEDSYLRASEWLDRSELRGGVYLGVGPEQNLSFIAMCDPELAFIIDVRRDNLLLHLFYKSLFEEAAHPAQWLALLLGRDLGSSKAARPRAKSIHEVLARVTAAPRDEALHTALLERTWFRIAEQWHVPTQPEDEARLGAIAKAFFDEQLELRFDASEHRLTYPTFGELLVARDASGTARNFLADAEAFERVKKLQLEHRVVPIVGDLSGPHALRALSKVLERTGQRLSVAYVSNVEQYLLLDGHEGARFAAWQANLAGLPSRSHARVVRTYYDRNAPLPGQPPHGWAVLGQLVRELTPEPVPGSYRELALTSESTGRAR